MKVSPQRTRIYVAGIVLFILAMLVFVHAAFDLNPLFDLTSSDEIILLTAVSTLVFLVLVVFGFILARTLFKVWTERKQRMPGSSFKTSLLVTLIALTLVPAVVMFSFGFGLGNRRIDKRFSATVESTVHTVTERSQ